MYNKQVIDYAECLLRHKQAQQQAQTTPTIIDVVEDEQGVCYDVNSDGNEHGKTQRIRICEVKKVSLPYHNNWCVLKATGDK